MKRILTSLLVLVGLGVALLPPAGAAERVGPAPTAAAPATAAAPRLTTVVVRRSQATPWPVTSVTRQPRLVGSTPARRATVAAWAKAVVAAHTEVIRKENRSRVAEPGPCPESPRASISSVVGGGVLAGRWISTGMSFTSYPGCAGNSLWTHQATATWNLVTGVRATLRTFMIETWPLTDLIAGGLPQECAPEPGFIDRDPVARWSLTAKGILFWLDRYEWGRMGACGSQRVLVPWRYLKLTPAGERVAAFYGGHGGTGYPSE